jgi:hypothetical protein
LIPTLIAFTCFFFDWFMTRALDSPYDSASMAARREFAERVLNAALELSPGLGIGIEPLPGAYIFNDSSGLIYFLYVFGIFALFLLIPILIYARGWRGKFLVALILTSKLSPTYPFIWLLFNLLTEKSNAGSVAE